MEREREKNLVDTRFYYVAQFSFATVHEYFWISRAHKNKTPKNPKPVKVNKVSIAPKMCIRFIISLA